jgi:hypothetical protein
VAARPIVDGIVEDIEEQVNILRVDIHTDFGRELRRRIGFSYTPEFILFDNAGEEVWRDHVPPSPEQLRLVDPP